MELGDLLVSYGANNGSLNVAHDVSFGLRFFLCAIDRKPANSYKEACLAINGRVQLPANEGEWDNLEGNLDLEFPML